MTGDTVEIAFVDQGYTGEQAAEAAEQHGISLEVVKLPTTKRGFVLLPRRWVVERSFAWMARFRRLARDYERLGETLVAAYDMCGNQRFVGATAPSARLPAREHPVDVVDIFTVTDGRIVEH